MVGPSFPYERIIAYGDLVFDLSVFRRAIAAASVLVSVGGLLALGSPGGPQSPIPRVLVIVYAVLSLPLAAVWWFGPWPHERISRLFVWGADLAIGGTLLTSSDPMLAMPGTALLAGLGLYVTLAHNPRMLLFHILLVELLLTVLLVRVFVEGIGRAKAYGCGLLTLAPSERSAIG